MAVKREKLKSIPGTTIFDGAESRKGYRINKFAMSFTKPENRKAFTANEEAYMEKWKLDQKERKFLRDRDFRGLWKSAAVIYTWLWKSVPALAMGFTMSERSCAARPLRSFWRLETHRGQDKMAKIIGGIGTSHVPSIGKAFDMGQQEEPDWKPVFDAYKPV